MSEVGQELAKIFADNGFELHLVARQSERLIPLQQNIQAASKVKVSIHELDLLHFEQYDKILKPLAMLSDAVIFIAGYYVNQALAESETSEAIKEMDINYKAGVLSLNIFKNIFQEKNKGTIIGVSSVSGERGRKKNYIYGSAKAGFTTYLSGLRNQLYPQNIHVISVIPGFINSKMIASMNVPKSLTASTQTAAEAIYKGFCKQKNVIYTLPIWRWIMLIIRNIPESIFKKLSI